MHHVGPLVALLHGSLPWISFPTRVLIESLVLCGGEMRPCSGVAKELGFTTRFGLTRALRKEGIPSLPRLSGWIRVLIWTWNWEHARIPLGPAAVSNGQDPAVYYRLVRRMTKQSWSAVRERGTDWVLQNLLEECADRSHHSPQVKKKSGGVSPAALMRQARGLTRTSARPLCWPGPAPSNPRKSRRSSWSWCGTPSR